MSRPAVVKGVKAVEHALEEGQYPVVDKNVDVFAIPSAEGIDWFVYIYYLSNF